MILLAFSVLAASPEATESVRPERVISAEFRQATKSYGKCLSDAAEDIAKTESDISERYRAFAKACTSKRADMIAIFVADNSSADAYEGPQVRSRAFEWVSKHADDRAVPYAIQVLDTSPPLESPQ